MFDPRDFLEAEDVETPHGTVRIVTDGQFAWTCWPGDYDAALEDDSIGPGDYEGFCASVQYLADSVEGSIDSEAHEWLARNGYNYNWS
jgi:hypothetical protein